MNVCHVCVGECARVYVNGSRVHTRTLYIRTPASWEWRAGGHAQSFAHGNLTSKRWQVFCAYTPHLKPIAPEC